MSNLHWTRLQRTNGDGFQTPLIYLYHDKDNTLIAHGDLMRLLLCRANGQSVLKICGMTEHMGFEYFEKLKTGRRQNNRHVLSLLAALFPALIFSGCTVPGTIVGGVSRVGSAALSAPGFEKRVNDAGLMVTLNRALLQEDDTLLLKIKIDALAGRVMLTGTVQDEVSHKTLQKIVGDTAGIRQVFDYVKVSEPRGFSKAARDGLISTRLRTAMMTDQAISAVNFIIRTHRGVVYILGIAPTEEEAQRVVNHARTISGVVEVKLEFETVDEMILAFAAAEELSNASSDDNAPRER